MKGICFKESLFHLTVQGIKKQTRRIIPLIYEPVAFEKMADGSVIAISPDTFIRSVRSRYKVGETVYLKEPYYVWDEWDPKDGQFSYKFDNPEKIVPFWENKLFMPEKAARHFIKITAVRAERLQDISEEDCLLEGISYFEDDKKFPPWGYQIPGKPKKYYASPKKAYADLIDEINGAGTQEGNPFVWVYDYELKK